MGDLRPGGWARTVVRPVARASGHNVRLVEATEIDAVVESLDPDGYVDGLIGDGRFTLMKPELIEPGMALDLDADTAARFAEATLRVIQAGPSTSR